MCAVFQFYLGEKYYSKQGTEDPKSNWYECMLWSMLPYLQDERHECSYSNKLIKRTFA